MSPMVEGQALLGPDSNCLKKAAMLREYSKPTWCFQTLSCGSSLDSPQTKPLSRDCCKAYPHMEKNSHLFKVRLWCHCDLWRELKVFAKSLNNYLITYAETPRWGNNTHTLKLFEWLTWLRRSISFCWCCPLLVKCAFCTLSCSVSVWLCNTFPVRIQTSNHTPVSW